MMRHHVSPAALVALAASLLVTRLLCGDQACASPTIFPTGVTVPAAPEAWRSALCYGGPDGVTHVIDMEGRELHRWPHVGLPGAIIDPALVGGTRGDTLLQLDHISGADGLMNDRSIAILDWNDRVLWQWGAQAPGGAARQNHDWTVLRNGDVLILAGLTHVVTQLGPEAVNDQAVYEVDRQGRIVWHWIAGDHLDEFGFPLDGLAYLRQRESSGTKEPWGYLEINDMQPLGPNRWFEHGDRRFAPDNIMINARKGNVVLIIEKATGKVVWRLGPDFPTADPDRRINNHTLPRPVDQISGAHDAHLIPEGLPGADDLLMFDDQGPAGFPRVPLGIYVGSRVLEIDPTTLGIVWQYTAIDSGQPPWSFFSSFVSSAQRLPNGNTFIDEGMDGRLFQVTPKGKIVWEYVTPYVGTLPMGNRTVESRVIYRAQAVPPGWLPERTTH